MKYSTGSAKSIITNPARAILGGVLALLALIAWGQFIVAIFWPAATRDEWRRPALWVAARLTIEGHGDLIYSPQAFHDASLRLGAVPDIFDANAPTTVLPYLPLAALSENSARSVWLFFSLACFVLAWVLLLRALRLPMLVALALTVIVPLFQPWRYSFYVGQTYPAMLLFSVAGALLAARAEHLDDTGVPGQRGRASVASGIAFALVAIFRSFYGAVQLVPSLVKRQWKVVGTSLGVFGVGAALTLPLVGAAAWGTSFNLAITWRDRPETAVTAYQSVNNFLTHLLRYDPTWNPGPIVNASGLVAPLWLVVALAILGISVLALWRSRTLPVGATMAERLLPYSLATPIALLTSPISEDYHYLLTLFPLLVVAAVLLQESHFGLSSQLTLRAYSLPLVAGWVILAAAAILLGAPWRYYNVPVGPGWEALLYYPRLYGNLLLWGLILVLLHRRESLVLTKKPPDK